MMKRAPLFILGAALFASAALVVSSARRPASAQSSPTKNSTSSTTKKKKTSSKYRKKSSRARAQMAPTPDRVKEIQAALQKDGSYAGETTGKWDAATTDALRKFQDKNGFPPTGKIDALSLNKLGLGSETAGKGAPVPAAAATSAPVRANPASATSVAEPAPIPAAASPAK